MNDRQLKGPSPFVTNSNQGDYSTGLSNGGSSNVTPELQPSVLALSGMDWVGASTFGSYAPFGTSDQTQAGASNNIPLFSTSSQSIYGMSSSSPGLPAPQQFAMPTPAYGDYGPTAHLSVSPSFPANDAHSFLTKGSAQLTSLPPPAITPSAVPSNQNPASSANSGSHDILNGSYTSQQPPSEKTTATSTHSPNQGSSSLSSSLPQTLPDDAFFNLFWPNWPASLPSPKLVYSLCDIFFSKRWLCEGIVNRDKFFKGLACPPHHQAFPHVSLLHAMCAIATKFVAPDTFGLDKETYWKSDPSPTDYHAAAAKIHIDSAVIRGEKLLCVAQAIILVCFYSYTSARFVEVWLYCGLATRIASPLGLNHIESLIDEAQVFGPLDEDNMFHKGPAPASCVPMTEEDKQEQAHTFWLAFTCDRLAAACTGWASSMPEDEVSTLLPKPKTTPGSIQPITSEELEQLSLSSPTFFTSNALPLVNAVNLQYKSVVLLGRVCSFLRSAPWPLGADIIKGARNYRAGVRQNIADIPNSPEFKKLDALIVAFRLSFPKEYKNVLKRDDTGAVEIALVSAHVIPHAATILLHEAFCEQEEDVSMQRCLTSARAILSIIYLLWDINYDVSMLQPFVSFCWAVAGRTLVRELAFKQDSQDELAEATLKQEISVILSAMRMFSQRNALGVVVSKALQGLLDNPSLCHPRNNGGRAMADTCGGSGPSPMNAGTTPNNTSDNFYSNPSSVLGSASIPASEPSLIESRSNVDSPAQIFNNLLWELEQPGMQISENEKFKKMELDLRSLIGPSYDQLLNLPATEAQSLSTGSS